MLYSRKAVWKGQPVMALNVKDAKTESAHIVEHLHNMLI